MILDYLRNIFAPMPTQVQRKRRPTGSALRNPADPHQAARIEAAAAKRERKQKGLHYRAIVSTDFNRAHHPMHGSYTENLNPFYIAK